MSESPKPTEPADNIYRLVDIVAEEVSLVDHAANQRRFLIVKRNDPMADPQADPQSAPQPDPLAIQQAAPQPNPQHDPESEMPTPEEEVPVVEELEPADNSMLDAALAALQRLTETVETLSVLAGGDAREVIGEMATELRTLADELVGAIGEPEPVEAAAPTSAPASEQVTALIESVRGALADLRPLIGEAKRGRSTPSPVAGNSAPQGKNQSMVKSSATANVTPAGTANPAPTAAPSADDPVRKEISALTAAVTKLTDAAQGQLQRLTHLEKRFGVPNSTPTREPGAVASPEEVGWPLDLNRRLDRESVDKSISFHD